MEDNIQTIFVFLISIVLLFIFPVYVAYEKKDDISYALVLSYTQDFVDNVRNKGYLTKRDYDDYYAKLSATGNVYDVNIEHKHQNMVPIIKEVKCYNKTAGVLNLDLTYTHDDYDALTDSEKESLKITYAKVDIIYNYNINSQIYNTNYINSILEQGVDYYMNTDDIFCIIVKNRNTTLATVMYNLVTIGDTETSTRIYVNYAGQVLDTKWYEGNEEIKYTILDSKISDLILYEKADSKIVEKSKGDGDTAITLSEISTLTDNFNIDIKAKLYREVSGVIDEFYQTKVVDMKSTVNDLTDMNVILRETRATDTGIAIELGYTGVSVLKYSTGTRKYECIASYAGKIYPEQKITIAVKNNNIAIFIDGERMSHGSYSGNISLTSSYVLGDFKGEITMFNVYKTS